MATYVMSDIHGNSEKYIQALKSINLKYNDTLYVLGDVIDRGTSSCKILLDMMYYFKTKILIIGHIPVSVILFDKNSDKIKG